MIVEAPATQGRGKPRRVARSPTQNSPLGGRPAAQPQQWLNAWRVGIGKSTGVDLHNLAMLWIKAFHIVFVTSWFAGLFYLPRLFVNLATVPPDSHAERERLLLMARKLYRFSSLLMVPALGLGLWLWLGYGIGRGPGNGWMHAKLLLVVLAIGYHHACRSLLRKFELFTNKRSERWFRVFNESAVLIFIGIVVLVIVKPF